MRGRHFYKLNVTAHCWQYLSIQVAIPTLHVVNDRTLLLRLPSGRDGAPSAGSDSESIRSPFEADQVATIDEVL